MIQETIARAHSLSPCLAKLKSVSLRAPKRSAQLLPFALDGFAIGEAVTQRLNSLYYDTAEFSLAKAGLSLRVRKNGRGYIQTVKDTSSGALLSERSESECELPSAEPDMERIPDEGLRERIRSLGQPGKFEPVVETQIRRITRAITSAAGDEVELALDKGEIRPLLNGHGAVAVNELELELKRGAPIALYEIARRLSRKAPLTISVESKSARGLRAVQNGQICANKPGRAALPEHCTTEDAFAATLAHCLRHLTSNIAALADARLPEGVHQMRVGLRRLRAALAGAGPLFHMRVLQILRDRAKTLADMFGDTRELDVFGTELLPPVEQSAKLVGLPPLRLVLEELRRDSWDRTIALGQSDDFTGFLIDLGAAIENSHLARGREPRAIVRIFPARSRTCCENPRQEAQDSLQARPAFVVAECRGAAPFADCPEDTALFGGVLRTPVSGSSRSGFSETTQPIAGSVRHVERCGRDIGNPAPDRRTCGRAEQHLEFLEAAAFVDGWHQSRVGPTWQKARRRWKRFVKTEPFWRDS